MRTATRLGTLGAVTSLSLTLAACGGSNAGSMDPSSMSSSTSSAPSTTAASTAASNAAVDAQHNDQDVMFAQMMIVHHRGAIDMADMATTSASSQDVKTLAATIKTEQAPEIDQMTSWLQAWGAPVIAGDSSMSGMDHSTMGSSPTDSSTMGSMSMDSSMSKPAGASMPGMMTNEQMTQLQNATGTAFDKLFLQLMIEHHTGAVTMAQTEQQQGSNAQAKALADSIVTSQKAEIDQMNQMLTTLG